MEGMTNPQTPASTTIQPVPDEKNLLTPASTEAAGCCGGACCSSE